MPANLPRHYSPFGSCIQELQYAYSDAGDTSKYRFGFGKFETENTISNNFYNSELRLYNSSIGVWITCDPEEGHPHLQGLSPYVYSFNCPIVYSDEFGDLPWPSVLTAYSRVSSEQGYRIHPISGKRTGHGGMDIATKIGTNVRAMANGTVVKVGFDMKNGKGYGKYIVISHGNGYYTLYAHLEMNGVIVKVNQKVSNGENIATSGNTGGSTGPHLHLELIKSENLSGIYNYKNKLNPRDFGDLQDFLSGNISEENTENNKLGTSNLTSNNQKNITKTTDIDKKTYFTDYRFKSEFISSLKYNSADKLRLAKSYLPYIETKINSYESMEYQVNATELNLRSGAGINFNIQSTLENGATIHGTGNISGDWIEIKTSGNEIGWVNSKFIKTK